MITSPRDASVAGGGSVAGHNPARRRGSLVSSTASWTAPARPTVARAPTFSAARSAALPTARAMTTSPSGVFSPVRSNTKRRPLLSSAPPSIVKRIVPGQSSSDSTCARRRSSGGRMPPSATMTEAEVATISMGPSADVSNDTMSPVTSSRLTRMSRGWEPSRTSWSVT
jgi:hypothetical protein